MVGGVFPSSRSNRTWLCDGRVGVMMLDFKAGDSGSIFSPVMLARTRRALVTGAIVGSMGMGVWPVDATSS